MAYRVGIVGTGGIARAHGNACQQIEEAELVAIYDVSEEQLAKYGEEFGVEARYTDLHEMLAKEALDNADIMSYFKADFFTSAYGVKGGTVPGSRATLYVPEPDMERARALLTDMVDHD